MNFTAGVNYVCRLCDGKATSSRIDLESSGLAAKFSSWVRCSACGSYQLLNLPDSTTLDAFYSHYDQSLHETVPHPGANRGQRYEAQYLPTVRNEFLLTIADLGIQKALASAIQPSILDFGCQNACFLDVSRDVLSAGLTVGTDFDTPRARSIEKAGHRFVSLDGLAKSGYSFDLIGMWDVFEHILDLEQTFNILRRVCRPGALLAISTPHAGILADTLGPKWAHFLPVQHITLPSRIGLVSYLAGKGFALKKALSYGANAPSELIPPPYKNAFDTLAKKSDMGSTQIASFQFSPNHSHAAE